MTIDGKLGIKLNSMRTDLRVVWSNENVQNVGQW
jgi:hypothetical protein